MVGTHYLQRQVTFQRTTAGGLVGGRASGAMMNAVSETTAQRSLFFFFFLSLFPISGALRFQALYKNNEANLTFKETASKLSALLFS